MRPGATACASPSASSSRTRRSSPTRLALPDFLQTKVPLVPLRRRGGRPGPKRVEPRYDHPEFQRAFGELVDLLAAESWTATRSSSSPT